MMQTVALFRSLVWLSCLTLANTSEAFALGSLGFDSEGFFKNSPYRSNSSTWFSVDPSFEAQGPYLAGSRELARRRLLSDAFSSSLTIDSGDTYIASSPSLGKQQATLGRRRFEWSNADQFWGLGMWQPRFLWDTFRPETDGLTGAFYTYESQQWKFLAFASPMTIPDRSFPVVSQNGKLVSSSPDWLPPFSELQLLNRTVPIQLRPSDARAKPELLVKPGVALSVHYDENDRSLRPDLDGAHAEPPTGSRR